PLPYALTTIVLVVAGGVFLASKLLFGSDFPVATPQETIDAIPRINDLLEGTALPRVPVDELMQVVHRDALDILGLD
ncbi:MAG: hypothetical protein EBV45_12390, partial [Chloroflexi bacterium]|nr:hypothetical protein [Chloroflexota bacterium]